ncbi:glycosyl transferase [Microtetraspora sp. NBRC 13810]|uniref:glycosyltransferase family 2 protein n=1 Tax=Microtetraspora sp. NBRC 13810 TaxID=3030990 RepID=UPI0024A16AE2|nr:glycosyltransferase family 2 protein [Microtetraspora sp. NBRC 13810]GLW10464.1 glycosyl transferase [Microtetraspora sp. NBRC 13810]
MDAERERFAVRAEPWAPAEHDVDVSVLVPVYNCRPWLDRCLTSLLVQRVAKEIVAVDDGSTDGGGALLDLYAAQHPGVIRVLRPGPPHGAGRARNLALAQARGRYVFFCDADDYMGPEALERMLAMADRNASDIVLGKIVGHGRRAPSSMFHVNADRVALQDSPVYNSLSCFKLFRRAMLETHGIRFDESLRVGEDIIFTTHAYCHAEVISVLADYDCYHLVDRPDGSSVMQQPGSRDPVGWLRMIRRPIELMARHVQPGPLRDHMLRRHFKIDALAQLGAPFLAADDIQRKEIAAEVADLCVRWLTDGVRARLDEVDRQRLLSLADIDRLVRLARIEAATIRRTLAELRWEGTRLVLRGRVGLEGVRTAGPTSWGAGRAHWSADPRTFELSLVLRPRRESEGVAERVFPVTRRDEEFTAVLEVADLPPEVWSVYVAIECEGVTRRVRLGADRDSRIARPAPLAVGPTIVLPYFTRSHGNLSIDVGGHVIAVPCGVRLARARWGFGHRLHLDGRVTVGDGVPAAGAVRRMVWRERQSGRERSGAVALLPGGAFSARQALGRFGPGIWDAYLELAFGGPSMRIRIETGTDPLPARTWWRWAVRRTVRPYSTAGKGRLSAVVRIVTPRSLLRRIRG